MKNLLALIGCLWLIGCASFPLSPGRSSIKSADGNVVSVKQSQNPLTETVQDYKRVVGPQGAMTEEVHTKIGAAQKDVARELGAKLSSLRPVMWVGILVFLFGASSFVWPYTKMIVGGSVTTSAVITGAGLAMIVLPVLVVGHELLILAVGAGAAVLYWFAHRHGGIHAELKTIKDNVLSKLQ